ncbi:MAG: ABC transporter ATP-binding protein [Muribaculaceae bacterium]|nr:ABC transporter ATP-binding protein [Muribaculaceae bacterium]
MTTLRLENICKSFGHLQVLRDISLEVAAGQITSITGPSGAGKTTLLQIMGTLDSPDSGRVLYDDVDVTSLDDRRLSAFRNRHIGFVFQFHQLLPEFTACENVMLPAQIGGMKRSAAQKRALELLDALGMAERAGHKPAALSGGEKQRVAVARALVNEPDIVFADEPTGSLDTRNRDEIQQLFLNLRDRFGQGFVIVTHDPELARAGERIIELRDGIIV